jgi:hypothetical protein
MKKIENWLILPVLVLYCWSFANPGTLDLHLHDTYFVIAGVSLWRYFAGFLLIIFGLYKTIRNRHQTINPVFAVPHILITMVLIGFLVIPFTTEKRYIDYSNWTSYQSKLQWEAIAVISYLLTQFIFLIYFIIQLIKKPATHNQ